MSKLACVGLLLAIPLSAAYSTGDIFVSAGIVFAGAYHYSSTGGFIDILVSDTNAWGAGFDKSGDLYSTTNGTGKIIKFDKNATPPPELPTALISGTTLLSRLKLPSAIAFDDAGNFYVAQGSGAPILEFTAAGAPLRSLTTTSTGVLTDMVYDVKLSPDMKTLYYSTGSSIKRLDLASNTVPTNFADVGGLAREFQLLPGGGMLVANGNAVVRVDSHGSVVQTYAQSAAYSVASVALTPDKAHFWTEGFNSGVANELDLVTGAKVASFKTPSAVFSIAVFDPAPASIPEPASTGLLALGLLSMVAVQSSHRLRR